jgi:hypothetical protein
MPVMLVIAVLAIISSIGSWREKPWGYFLAILLCAGENVMAVKGFYSQPANFRFGDIFGLALSGVPLAGGTIAAFLLLFAHYGKKPGRAPEPTSGTAPRHG